MVELLLPLVTALMWAAVLFKTDSLRRAPQNHVLRSLWLSLLALALALTALNPPVSRATDGLSGVPLLADMISRILVLIAGCAAQSMLLHLTHPDAAARARVRRRVLVLVPAVVVMVGLFGLAHLEQEISPGPGSTYSGGTYGSAFLAVFLGYLVFPLLDVIRLCWRYAAVADRELLATGLRSIAAGCSFGLAYLTFKCIHLGIAVMSGRATARADLAPGQFLALTGLTLIVIGTTLPAWGPRLRPSALRRRIRGYVAHQRLYPLWSALYGATPEIALDPPRSRLADALDVRDIDFRLYRRVIEIRDGCLALRPYVLPEDPAPVARGVSPTAPRADGLAAAEARVLAEALWAKQEGRQGRGVDRGGESRESADMDAEVAWLEKVALHFSKERVPQQMAREGANGWRAASGVMS